MIYTEQVLEWYVLLTRVSLLVFLSGVTSKKILQRFQVLGFLKRKVKHIRSSVILHQSLKQRTTKG